MRRLIVNADDFGISEGVNRGILECHRRGVVTSTSLMVNLPAFSSAVSAALNEPHLGVGIHLNLTSGYSVLPPDQVPTLVSPDGRFHALGSFVFRLLWGNIRLAEVQREFTAQIELAKASGVSPSHLDTHQHIHFYPPLKKIIIDIARHYGIKRVRGADTALLRGFYWHPTMWMLPGAYLGLAKLATLSPLRRVSAQTATSKRLLGIGYVPKGHYQAALAHFLRQVPPGRSELICHPGHVDTELSTWDSWTSMREEEMRVLTASETLTFIQELGVSLGNN